MNSIPLSAKVRSSCSAAAKDGFAQPLWRQYGTVNLHQLREAVQLETPSFWEDEAQSQKNVLIHRPFHDRQGIQKVVFIFSDNEVNEVLHLPLWDQWKSHISWIFEKCGLEGQVVRCLLARMPPGATIPVHHDMGDWVARSHRVHVPVITHPAVQIRIGTDEKNLQDCPTQEA